MPSLKDVSEIIPEKLALKSSLRIDNVNPRTWVNVCHDLESFP
jgi:hypothetical protein